MQAVNVYQLWNIRRRELTRNDLHNLDTERVCIYLAYAVDLMAGSIEGLEPEDHRCRRTIAIVELQIHRSVTR